MKLLFILSGCLFYFDAGAQKNHYDSLLNKMLMQNRISTTTSLALNKDKIRMAVLG